MFAPCYQVNLKAHHVEYNRFYIPDVTSMVDIQEDYLKWFLGKADIVSTENHLVVTGHWLTVLTSSCTACVCFCRG